MVLMQREKEMCQKVGLFQNCWPQFTSQSFDLPLSQKTTEGQNFFPFSAVWDVASR
jgi:hypothetical protein